MGMLISHRWNQKPNWFSTLDNTTQAQLFAEWQLAHETKEQRDKRHKRIQRDKIKKAVQRGQWS